MTTLQDHLGKFLECIIRRITVIENDVLSSMLTYFLITQPTTKYPPTLSKDTTEDIRSH